MKYIGLDVHKEYIHGTVLDDSGRVVKSGKFKYSKEGFEEFFHGIGKAKVAIEAGYCWQPAYELLEDMGHDMSLAHPLKTRLIADVKIKTDAKASEALSQLLLMGWLPTSYVPPEDIRRLRELVRLREYLVNIQTRFKNKTHSALMKEGIRGRRGIFAKKRRAQLRSFEIDEVNRCVSILDVLDRHIRELSATIKSIAGESQEAKWLMSIPGIGYYSAVAILAEIGDVSRFSDPEKLCAYAGLVPSTQESGGKSTHGKITHQGSPILRWILVECVWNHTNNADDTSLTRFFHRVARNRGKQKAAVATARKLLKVVYILLKEKRDFRDFR
ncbi:MAG: IS110 family transposase [Acidobacteriota bacterium]